MKNSALFLTSLLLLPGCDRGDTEANLEDMCEETSSALSLEEASALGFSAADILAFADGAHASTFNYADGTTTPLTLEVLYQAGAITYIDSQPKEGEGDNTLDIAVICESRMEITVALNFTTSDGAFEERSTAKLQASNSQEAQLNVDLDPMALKGTYDLQIPDGMESYDEASLSIRSSIQENGVEGTLTALFTGSEETKGDEGTAWASQVLVGSWPEPSDSL